jgi:NADH:ubiquinone oxidoreductase subunit 6 (subunit J)
MVDAVCRDGTCPVHGGGAVKVVAIGAVVVFVIFYIMTSPDQAANIAHGSWHTAVHVAHGLGSFVDKLAS